MAQNDPPSLIQDFTTGSVPKQLCKFAAPLFCSNLLQIVYNMADMVIVGQVVGKAGLSAVSIGGDLTHFLTFLAMGFSAAGQIILSQYVGAGRRDAIGRLIGAIFTPLLCAAAILSVVCLALRAPILRLMNTPPEAWEAALAYSTVCMCGLLFICGYNIISAVLRGLGDARHPFLFVSVAALLNIALDLLFVPGMGAMGAALATVISQGVSFVCCAAFLWRRRASFGFVLTPGDFLRLDPAILRQLVGLGVPMAIKYASVHISKLCVNAWINAFGVAVSAVSGIASKFSSVSNLISNAVNAAGASMVGQNIGAGRYARVPRIMRTAFAITFAFALLMCAALYLFPAEIFGLFTSEADVLPVAMEYLPVAALVFLGSASRAPMNALINGSGSHLVNFVTAILDGLVLRIGLALLLGEGLAMGYTGFWLGDALAGFTPLWIGLAYYLSGRWKRSEYTGAHAA